ncbi:hypothetical protein JIQ42_06310 [Leishmania sp. Namibia]|uniref:hypothetical protein n=1 Tax=Leishmania sp. Namibia TaxID=2802991 RepID=UPI001B4334EE|nr:hypothetical protein JIQ42_06310 [Leishmania sp. Namibia]
MQLLGVELWCCRCNRYLIIDTIIFAVVVTVCVPFFISVSAARVYAGILLGVAVIFICRLWRFLPSHKRWVERQAGKMAAKLVTRRCIVRPPIQLQWLVPEDPPASGSGSMAAPLCYQCTAPSSPRARNYQSGAPVSGHAVPSAASSTHGCHLPYGGWAAPPPLATRSPFSLPQASLFASPPGSSPSQLLLLPSPLRQQVSDHAALGDNGSAAFSHRAFMASRASSGQRSSAASIEGGGDARVDWIHSLPLALEGASYVSPEGGSLAPSAYLSRQGSHCLRGGDSPSRVFLSQSGGPSLGGSGRRSYRQRSRSPSPPYSFRGERPLWQGWPKASPTHSPCPASPVSYYA